MPVSIAPHVSTLYNCFQSTKHITLKTITSAPYCPTRLFDFLTRRVLTAACTQPWFLKQTSAYCLYLQYYKPETLISVSTTAELTSEKTWPNKFRQTSLLHLKPKKEKKATWECLPEGQSGRRGERDRHLTAHCFKEFWGWIANRPQNFDLNSQIKKIIFINVHELLNQNKQKLTENMNAS